MATPDGGGGVSNPYALRFYDYSFIVHHPVNQDDRHLLAHAIASDFLAELPDGIFSNQNPNLGKFWNFLQQKMLVNFMSIRSISLPFRIYFMAI
jgi:hypothetical protein